MLLLAAPLALLAAPMSGHAPAWIGTPDPRPPIAGLTPRPPANRGIRVRIPPPADGPPTPHIHGPRDPTRPLIVLDPGHGGHDPGARNARSGVAEKDLTLGLAEAVRDALLKGGRLRVALTREDDRFLALEERYGLARDMGAALLISIHADASDERDAHGATVYTLSNDASDREAASLAVRENRANQVNGIDLSGRTSAVSSILIDLSQRETLAASTRFAELLYREGRGLMAFRDPWRRSAALVVLRAPDTPSVLVEAGYVSNDAEAAELGAADGKGKFAQAIARAVAVFAATLGSRAAP